MRIDHSQLFNFLPIPVDIHFGFGALALLPDRVRSLGCKKAFLVTDPGIRQAGILDRLIRILENAQLPYACYDQVAPDSGSGLIEQAGECLKLAGGDVVVGIGGGSSLDTAKAVAALATNPGSPLQYEIGRAHV